MSNNSVAPAAATAEDDADALRIGTGDVKALLGEHLDTAALRRQSIENEQGTKVVSKWVIMPKNRFKIAWDLAQAVVLIYLSIDVPIRVGLSATAYGPVYILALIIDLYFW